MKINKSIISVLMRKVKDKIADENCVQAAKRTQYLVSYDKNNRLSFNQIGSLVERCFEHGILNAQNTSDRPQYLIRRLRFH